MTKFCVFLTCSLAALAGIAQNRCAAQSATLDAARPRFGNPVQPSQPVEQVAPAAPAAQGYSQWQQGAAGGYVPGTSADRDTPLGVGDIVTFSIQEDRDQPVKLRVTDSGELDIPYAGRVSALGKTCDVVASEAKRALEGKYYYKATVRLGIDQRAIGRSLGKVYVTGVVRTPGPQDLYPGEKLTVSAAIVKAGGFTQFSDTKNVRVTRKSGGKVDNVTVDVGAVLKKGQLERDIEVKDGDYIYVPQKIITF